MINDPENRHGNFSSSFLLGVIVGAAVAYLFGTKSGQKVRDELLKDGSRLLEKINEDIKEAKEKVEEKVETGAQIAQEVKEEVQEVASQVPDHIEQIQKKGRRFFFRRSQSSQES